MLLTGWQITTKNTLCYEYMIQGISFSLIYLHLSLSLSCLEFQSSIYGMDTCEDGFATASKDGCVRIWDVDFQPISTINLRETNEGYPGTVQHCSLVCSS